MTHHEANETIVNPAWAEAIDALLDGEPIQASSLRRALDAPEARDYFVDALTVRRLARDRSGESRPPDVLRSRRPIGVAAWLTAAMLVLTATTSGYMVGRSQAPMSSSESLDGAPAAPPPTTVIRLVPGVNWTEGEVVR